MVFHLLLTAGFVVLCLALRSISIPIIFRLGNVCMLVASYLFGWTITEHPAGGFFCVSLWFLFPWVDLIGRVRRMQLPAAHAVEAQIAPGSQRFPDLEDLTEEAEAEGFVKIEDCGWDHAGQRHFVRVLSHASEPLRAAINLVEGDGFAFFYLTVSSRTTGGKFWHTWNYPFSLSLKPSPDWNFQRLREVDTFLALLEAHRAWLKSNNVTDAAPATKDADALTAELEAEIQTQVSHNLKCGVLLNAGEGLVRYSWKGCLFLWFQFLRELVRL
jgi:hypothetical protein